MSDDDGGTLDEQLQQMVAQARVGKPGPLARDPVNLPSDRRKSGGR